MTKTFRSQAKNYGVFNQDELMEFLDVDNYSVIYEEGKRHLVFRVVGLVMRNAWVFRLWLYDVGSCFII